MSKIIPFPAKHWSNIDFPKRSKLQQHSLRPANKYDWLLTRIQQAKVAAQAHLDFNYENDFPDIDIGRELGYLEAMDIIEYWIRRKDAK